MISFERNYTQKSDSIKKKVVKNCIEWVAWQCLSLAVLNKRVREKKQRRKKYFCYLNLILNKFVLNMIGC